jgi:hypothetical protein
MGGGILEAFGRLFRNDLRFFVCPAIDNKSGELTSVHNLKVQEHLRHLYLYLMENGYIKELATVDKSQLAIFSHSVLEKIRNGDLEWETMVPDKVAKIIRERRLFNCPG